MRPLVFPGGSIGELAVNGTVNDLAVSGATPLALSAALIVEEGLETEALTHEIEAMAAAARNAGVSIATGDTKVVERGKADGLYITTTGVGVADPELTLSSASVRPGDKILCSGTLGDHGAAILIARETSSSKPKSSPTPGPSHRLPRLSKTQPDRACASCGTPRAVASGQC